MFNPQRMDFLLVFCIILFHHSAISAVIDNESVLKIKGDKHTNVSEAHRQLHTLVLENGMKIVLIEDVAAEESNVHLHVNGISAINDPSDIIGMAAFIEKMIFKCRARNLNHESFSSYIGRHGKMVDSFTLYDGTAFQFKIGHDHFYEALDWFGQCFIQPTFHKADIEHIVHDVHLEYRSSAGPAFFKSYRFCRAMCNNETCHIIPGKMNSVWNIHQLNDIDLGRAAENFFKEYYTSDSMSLTIISSESVENMSPIVAPLFSKVHNRSQKSHHKIQNELITRENFVGKLINMEIASEDDQYWIILSFPAPDLVNLTIKGTVEYLQLLLTYAGNGSFLKNWKDKNIIYNIETGPEFSSKTEFNMLTIDFETSFDGFNNLTTILESLFSFLAAIKERHNNEEWLYDNMRSLRMHMLGIDATVPMSAQFDRIFEEGQYFNPPLEKIDIEKYILEPEWDKQSLEYLLSFLNPENMQVAMVRMNSGSEFDKTTQIKYKADKLSKNFIGKLQNLNGTDDKTEIPKPLDFVNEMHEDDKGNKLTFDRNDWYQIPEIIFENHFHSIWFAEEGSGSTEVSFRMKILNDIHIMNSSRNFIITNLLVRTMNEMLLEYSSSDFTIELEQFGNAFLLQMHGKVENVSFLAQKCLSMLLNDKIIGTYLDYEKETMMLTANTIFQETVKQWSTINPDFDIWDEDFRDIIPGINLEDVEKARKHMNTGCHVESLIYGDISKEDALKLYNVTTQILPKRYGRRPLGCDILPNPTIILPDDSDYHLEADMDEDDRRTAVFVSFQLNLTKSHLRDEAILYFLEFVLENLTIPNLELDRQTWFCVKDQDIAWIFLFVLGSYGPQIMQSEIEAHIDYVTKEYLPQMKYTQFNKLKALKMKKYYKKEATLQEHVSNNLWPSILRKRALNQHQVLAEETARIRQQELIDFIKPLHLPPSWEDYSKKEFETQLCKQHRYLRFCIPSKSIAPDSPYRRKLSIHLKPTNHSSLRLIDESHSDWMDHVKKSIKIEDIDVFKQQISLARRNPIVYD